GPKLGVEGEGVSFQAQIVVGSLDFLLVDFSFRKARDKEFQHAGAPADTHRVPSAVPTVAIPDYADTPRIGRPHSEGHSHDAFHLDDVRPQLLVLLVMRPLS